VAAKGKDRVKDASGKSCPVLLKEIPESIKKEGGVVIMFGYGRQFGLGRGARRGGYCRRAVYEPAEGAKELKDTPLTALGLPFGGGRGYCFGPRYLLSETPKPEEEIMLLEKRKDVLDAHKKEIEERIVELKDTRKAQ